jgi:diguanylate cyclase (GGDEF)-like protein
VSGKLPIERWLDPLTTSIESDQQLRREWNLALLEDHRERPLVLVVDDDLPCREGMEELLRDRYELAFACDGEQAVLVARERLPDLIVMDIAMPGLNGVGAFEELGNDGKTAEIPVIFVSALGDEKISARCLNQGAADYMAKPASAAELLARIDRTLRDVRERRTLRALAQTDALTGLPNFGALSARLDQELKRAARYGNPLGTVMIDIDHLKQLNDSHGHEVGNRAIAAVARYLRDNLRETDFAARFGGDEFVVLLPHQTATESAVFAERIRAGVGQIRAVIELMGSRLTVSAGVACYWPERGDFSAAQLLQVADQALYDAKRAGRDRVVIAGRGESKEAGQEPER